MKRIIILLMVTFVFFMTMSCSINFDASIDGKVVDSEEFDNDPDTGGIENVRVYLYLKEDDLDADLDDWSKLGQRPDELKTEPYGVGNEKEREIDKRYQAMTMTSGTGQFTFPGIWWTDYFSEYGTDASVELGYFLFHHPDYGMIKNASSIRLYGDGRTRTISPFSIEKAINEAIVKGRVIDQNIKNNGQPVGIEGTSVKIYMPEEWTIDNGVVTVAPDKWKTEPTYTVLTDTDGYFQQTVSFRRFNKNSSVEDTMVAVRMTFSRLNYSQFCLNTTANTLYSGFKATGANIGDPYTEDRTIDLTDTSNWVLFDGATATDVTYWNGEVAYTESVGVVGGVMQSDYDLDADGNLDIYYPLTVTAKVERSEVIELADIHMRNNALQGEIAGRVWADANDDGLVGTLPAETYQNDALVTFKWFVADDTPEGSETTASKIYSDQIESAIEPGHYAHSINWTVYNYAGETFKRQFWIYAGKGTGATALLSSNSSHFTAEQLIKFSPVEEFSNQLYIPIN